MSNKPSIEFGNLYDLNKQLVDKTSTPLDPIALNIALDKIRNTFLIPNQDFALLCRERYDFTVFRVKENFVMAIVELSEVLRSRGKVLSVDDAADGTYEIWIKDFDDEVVMYKFFPCDWVIDC